ncbi:hypothetical protein D915_002431 [Fasciola hepatica]|uniref:Uncharacterized protein n=1 Tax=Fasciola hepatica TaxID=6192 RepID=A0A4E0S334_FASHE|nr:hypothetical protein D915_002431 [Fasciola hepatica]
MAIRLDVLFCGILIFSLAEISAAATSNPVVTCQIKGIVYNDFRPISWKSDYWKSTSPEFKLLNMTLCTSFLKTIEFNATLDEAFKRCTVTRAEPGSVFAYSTVLFNRTKLSKRGVDYRKDGFQKSLQTLILSHPSVIRNWNYYGKVNYIKVSAASRPMSYGFTPLLVIWFFSWF